MVDQPSDKASAPLPEEQKMIQEDQKDTAAATKSHGDVAPGSQPDSKTPPAKQ